MLKRLIPDSFILVLLAVIAAASILPVRGSGLILFSHISNAAIFLLFFFHGLRLSPHAVWNGLRNWRLQAGVLTFVFIVMPLAGLLLSGVVPALLPPGLWLGILFLCALPSTVQAAISSASMAGGNVAASVVAAALSNLAGVILTPLVVAALAQAAGGTIGLSAITKTATLLLLPFALGQIARTWLAVWAERHRVWIGRMDRTTIVLAVYTAFSAAVADNLWGRLDAATFVRLLLAVTLLLAFAMAGAWGAGRFLGLGREDRISFLFSGSHKTLATGAPMARILFPGPEAGLIIIPLMLYHQLQLIVSAWIAVRLKRSS